MKNILKVLFVLVSFVGALAQNTNANYRKADSLYALGKLEEAIPFYNSAAIDFQKNKKWNESILSEVGKTSCLFGLGKIDEAQQSIQNSKNSIEKNKLTNSLASIRCLRLEGLILQSQGKVDLAEKSLMQALQVNSAVRSEQEEAIILNYLGVLNWNKGNNELALEHLQRSLQLRIKNNANEEELAACYNDLGLVYSSTGKYDEAFNQYSEALKIYKRVYGENHPKVGLASNNLGFISVKQQKYDEALSQYQTGLTIWKTLYGEEHPNVAFVYSSIGQLHQEKGEFEEAIRFYDLAKKIYRKVYGDKHPEVAGIFNQEALLYVAGKKKEYDKALLSVQAALVANSPDFSSNLIKHNPTVSSYYKSSLMLNSLLIKAQLLEQQYTGKTLKKENLDIALSTLESCDSLIAKIRQLKTNKADKLELSSSSAQVYEEAIRICFLLAEVSLNKRYYWQKAFLFSEKGKSAVLQEAISDADAKQFANIPAAELKKEKELKDAIAKLEQKLSDKKNPAEEPQLKEQLFKLNREYDGFVANLEKQFPEYFALKYDVKTIDISGVQKLLDANEALVSYNLSDSTHRMYVFYIDKKKFKAYDLPLTKNLFRDLKGLKNAIKFDEKEILAKVSYEMYACLFNYKIPSGIKYLTIIPDGRLSTLPYEALFTKSVNRFDYSHTQAPYLVKRFGVSVQYSATLYCATKAKPAVTSSGVFLCAPVNFSGYGINNLPGSKSEIDSISTVLSKNGLQCFSFTYSEASEWKVKSSTLFNSRFVHFATHGSVNESKPELSQIYLSSDTSGGQDGHLYSGEIYNLSLSADLVTLSACQTGLGKVAKGEGLIGLSRALLYAGARNLIVSLWTVSDQSTSMMMTDFYKRYSPGSSGYRENLRATKLKMINEGVYSKPYYWAPFILVGD